MDEDEELTLPQINIDHIYRDDMMGLFDQILDPNQLAQDVEMKPVDIESGSLIDQQEINARQMVFD